MDLDKLLASARVNPALAGFGAREEASPSAGERLVSACARWAEEMAQEHHRARAFRLCQPLDTPLERLLEDTRRTSELLCPPLPVAWPQPPAPTVHLHVHIHQP